MCARRGTIFKAFELKRIYGTDDHATRCCYYNYEAEGVAEPVKEFRPLIFKDGNAYCALLGPDAQAGVFGCGASVDDALDNWTQRFKEVVSKRGNDEVSQYIMDTLQTSKQDVW